MKKRYLVHYGVPFNIKCRSFSTEAEARNFIREHVFADSRYCRLEVVEELDVHFEYVNHWEVDDAKVSRKLFDIGIAKREEVKS